jgi:hypothetical protein
MKNLNQEKSIEEDVKVIIEETEKESKFEVEDIVISLNTGQSMQAEYTTELLNGKLKALIIKNDEPINISIESSLGYILFEETDRQGIHYFPLKATALNYKAKQFNYVADCYYLNEELTIKIKGGRNSSCEVIFRLCG